MNPSLSSTPPDGAQPTRSASPAQLLRNTWELLIPIADEAAELFYARLFELDPSLRSLFHTEAAVQRQKLVDMLGMLVTSLDRPDELRSMLTALGARHASYGVRIGHYDTVGDALLWTLDEGLGLLSTDARNAWRAAWSSFKSGMLSAVADK